MIPELGLLCLLIALCMSFAQSVVPLLGVALNRREWIDFARPAAAGQVVFVVFAFGVLEYAFLSGDFSVQNVALNSNSALPAFFKFAAAWGSHEGSMVFWCLVLSLWTLGASYSSRHLDPEFGALMLGTLGLISTGILAFTIFTSSPFERLDPIPFDGRDLNPLLQDAAMVLHPPMLYLGYVGFSVAFAFALATLLIGRADVAWIRWARRWTLWPWMFLTTGITIGSWWAYYELGWGGWWFWDAVENASFMPWLLGTALLHSLAVSEKRGIFLSWTLLLCIGTFSLSLLGAFLTRSGILISVHAFASDSARGMFILALLGLITGGALLVYASRAKRFAKSRGFQPLSRESFLLLNNVLLVAATLTVLFGTLYPLFLDALNMGKISVGPPWFASAFLIPALPLVTLLGMGIHTSWRQMNASMLLGKVRVAVMVSIVVGFALSWLYLSFDSVLGPIGVALGTWVIISTLAGLYYAVVLNRGRAALPAAFFGMSVSHIGIGLFILGVTITSNSSVEMDRGMRVGERVEIAGYEMAFTELRTNISGPNYDAIEGVFEVYRSGQLIATLFPQKRIYTGQENAMTEAAIDAKWTRDLFVALGEDLGSGRWSVRLLYKPMIRFIWFGALVMALGAIIAGADRRYRVRVATPIHHRKDLSEPATESM